MNPDTPKTAAQVWLEKFVFGHGGVAGTVHQVNAEGGLILAAALNIPPAVQNLVAFVPRGKGMAGLALERCEAVSSCNIKDDNTGQVRPGAKAINAHAGVAVPIRGLDGQVRAVVGIAFKEEREILASEIARYEADAATWKQDEGLH